VYMQSLQNVEHAAHTEIMCTEGSRISCTHVFLAMEAWNKDEIGSLAVMGQRMKRMS
jgi:hypothetical protein